MAEDLVATSVYGMLEEQLDNEGLLDHGVMIQRIQAARDGVRAAHDM